MSTKTILPLITLLILTQAPLAQETLEEQFEQYYQEWLVECEDISYSSETYDYIKLPSFQKILNLGLPVVPLMVKKIKEHQETHCMIYGVRKLTKKFITPALLEEVGRTMDNKFLYWWEYERQNSQKHFEKLYQEWIKLPETEKMKKGELYNYNTEDIIRWRQMPKSIEKANLSPLKKTVYQQILHMGIFVLPYAVEKVEQGDTDLIEAINYWTDNAPIQSAEQENIPQDQLADYIPKWWETNKEKWLVLSVEQD